MPVDASGSLVPPVEPEATSITREIQQIVQSPPATPLDSRLVALLSNASFMNGSSLKPSIWSMLENIHRTPAAPNSNPTSSPTLVGSETLPFKEDEPAVCPNQLSNESFSDTSSIMVYSPLFPTQSDFVELAELVPYDTEPGEVEEERDVAVNSEGGDRVCTQEAPAGRLSWMWPISKWYRSKDQTQPSLGSAGPPQQPTPSQVGTNNIDANSPSTRTVKSQRAWVPSSSKISLQVFWWGYRLYLPPPVLEILSDRAFEVSARAEVLSVALSWGFKGLPIHLFPPPFQHFLVLLQGLNPFIGPIGSFISWAWIWISSYDAGHGVTLTATWILPVALIPGTWHENDFPKSPRPNSPIPLPRFRPFSMEPSSEPPSTPTMSTTSTTMTMTDDNAPTSAYATPMSSIISLYPPPDALDENSVVDLFLASSPTAWSGSPLLPTPPHLPPIRVSSPIHFPTTILPHSPNNNNHCLTPDSLPTTPVAHRFPQPLPPASTSSQAVPFRDNNPSTTLPQPLPPSSPTPSQAVPFRPNNPSTTLPSPRIRRKPRFSTHMGSLSPSFSISDTINPTPQPHLIHNNNNNSNNTSTTSIPLSPPMTPILTTTPIPMPPTPVDFLTPIPPDEEELPYALSPELVNQLLRGPVLRTVPLPDV